MGEHPHPWALAEPFSVNAFAYIAQKRVLLHAQEEPSRRRRSNERGRFVLVFPDCLDSLTSIPLEPIEKSTQSFQNRMDF
jgi:hypothetical protein